MVSASIDIVSAHILGDSQDSTSSEAVLTYFYKYPELEMGEFKKLFSDLIEANLWIEQYKGRSVMVRVNPRKPSESVLSEENLQELARVNMNPSVEESVKSELLKQLPNISWRIQWLTILIALLGSAGIIYTVASIMITITHPSEHFHRQWFIASGAFAFVFLLLNVVHSTWVHQIDTDDRMISRARQRFVPRWIRNVLVILFLCGYVIAMLDRVHEDLPVIVGILIKQLRDPIFELFGMSWCLAITVANIALYSAIQAANRVREINS
jgi:hypothetical protein